MKIKNLYLLCATAISMLFFPCLCIQAQNAIKLKGDINGDDNINTGDVIAICNYLQRMKLIDSEKGVDDISCYDVNEDGIVDVGDISFVWNHANKENDDIDPFEESSEGVKIINPDYEIINLPSEVASWSDFVIITINGEKEIWFFSPCPLSESDHRTYAQVSRVKMKDWSYAGRFFHNFGHANSVQCDSEKDILLMTNNSGHYSYYSLKDMQSAVGEIEPAQVKYIGETTSDFINGHFYWRKKHAGKWIWEDITVDFDDSYNKAMYVFYHVSEWVNVSDGMLDFHALNHSIIDVTNLGMSKYFDGVLCEQYGNTRDVLFLMAADGEEFQISKLLLGMGTEIYPEGVFRKESQEPDQYNGTYYILRDMFTIPTTETLGNSLCQGIDYKNGRVFTSNGHNGGLGMVWYETPESIKRTIVDLNKEEEFQSAMTEGLCIDDDYIYIGIIGNGRKELLKCQLSTWMK